MAVKYVIEKPEDVAAPLREHYAKGEDDKYYLATLGDHPKVAEFRTNNVALTRELDALRPLKAKWGDLDPDAARAALASAGDVATLKAELAAEKAARTEAQQKADKSRVRDTLRPKLLTAGVHAAALDIALDKAEPVFTMEGDIMKARPHTFSKSRPGELVTPDEWIVDATREFPFLFAPSSGGGAGGSGSGGGHRSGIDELRDPTPQQLGQHAAEIKAGTLRVVYSGE